jgi:hypothetical protein
MRIKWDGAPSCMNHMCWWKPHVPRMLVNHSPNKRCYTVPVSLLVKKTGPKSWTIKMPTQTLVENRCWCLDATVAWGLASTQIWVLWNFTVPFHVNPTSSANRVLATNSVSRTHLPRNHWQNTTLARWSGGVGVCTSFTWHGYSDYSRRILQTRGISISSEISR